MKLIVPKEIEVEVAEHFAPDGTSLGFLNLYEATELRVQIAKEAVAGYYAMWNGEKIIIEPDGAIYNWPSGFFDLWDNLMAELILLKDGIDLCTPPDLRIN